MRIVVFGAGGCVGGWICEELSLRPDVQQVACVRKWASAVRLARRGLDIRQTDLGAANELPGILEAADVVVNATMPPPSQEPELVTALYLACAKIGVRRFIQFSSAAVYGNRTGNVDETMHATPDSAYSRGKIEMESSLTRVAAESATQLIILRPSIIYGPFSEGWTIRYVERIARGRWRNLGRAGIGTCNLVHAQDVARSVIVAASSDLTPGTHILNINGPEVVSWNEYIERLGEALGLLDRVTPSIARFRSAAAVAGVLRMGGSLGWVRSLFRRSVGATRAAMMNAQAVSKLYPSSSELNLLSRRVYYSADQAALVLGVRPSIPLEDGLRQSVAWCRVHGVV